MPNMTNLIQLISVLSDMQARRQQLELSRQQFEEGKVEFAQRLGFERTGQNFQKLTKLLDTFTGATAESKMAARGMAEALGMDEPTTAAFLQHIQGAPTSAQTQTEVHAQRGYQNMAPEQQQMTDRETAATRLSGMNLGQQGISGVTGTMAQRAQQMIQGAQPGTPQAQAVQQATYGFMPGWGAFQQADAARGQVQADYYRTNATMIDDAAKVAAQLSSFKALGMLTPDQRIQGYNTMLQVLKEMRAKGGNDASRLTDMALFNRIAQSVDPSLIITNPDAAPDEAALADRMRQAIVPPGVPGVAPAINGTAQPAVPRPQYNFQFGIQQQSPQQMMQPQPIQWPFQPRP